MDCDHCDFSGDEAAMLQHTLDAHGDDLSSHDRDDLKRRLNKMDAGGSDGGMPVRTVGIAAGVLAVLVAAGYGAVASGAVSFTTDAGPSTPSQGPETLGAPGSVHEHAQFSVFIDGSEVDFSRPQYQVGQTGNRHIHFEGGDGSTIHKHATGVTVGYALEAHGFSIEDGCLVAYDGTRYCNGTVTTTVNGDQLQSPQDYVIRDGDVINVRYSEG